MPQAATSANSSLSINTTLGKYEVNCINIGSVPENFMALGP
jgi:hypothetical protein